MKNLGILLAVGAVGVVGWLFLSRRPVTTASTTAGPPAPSTSSAPPPAPAADPNAGYVALGTALVNAYSAYQTAHPDKGQSSTAKATTDSTKA